MNALFFTFTKRINSTKIPNDNSGTSKSVVLKENTSINNPVLKISNPDLSYNYVKFAGNYYFIQDIVLGNNNIYEIHCTIDVLGTFRSDILGYTAFVKRSASSYDVNLNDNLIASGQEIAHEVYESTVIDNDLNGSPHYALRMASGKGIRTYWLTYLQLSAILDYMFTDTNISDIMSDAFANFFVNPEEYILSLMYFRCNANSLSSEVVKFGFYETDVTADYIDPLNPYANYTKTLTIPARYYNDFRDFSSAYTKCLINFAGYGVYELDPIYLQSTLSVTYTIDYLTGACTIRLFSDSKLIAKLNGRLGANIQIASASVSGAGIIGGLLEMGAGVTGANPLMFTKGALDLSQTIISPQVNSIGNQDSIANIISNPASVSIYVRRMASAGIPTNEKGRPYCQNVLLSNLSGYCECLNASVPTGADETMKEMINTTLNNGFYIE